MPRMRQGRMLYPRGHRRAGRMHPRLYSGRRPRRRTHNYFGTQVSPYGAGGGGRRQAMTAHAGSAGNVYAAMLHQSRRGGTNLGMRTVTPGYRGTRMHKGFSRQQADIKRRYRGLINAERKKLRGAVGADKNQIRNRLAELRGGKRSATRGHAARWSKQFGASPRIGINVGQRNGRRVIQGLSFRRQRGGQDVQVDRARKRYMRSAERMRGQKLDARRHGGWKGEGKTFGLEMFGPNPYAYKRTHADYSRPTWRNEDNRIQGFTGGNRNYWNTGPYAGMVRTGVPTRDRYSDRDRGTPSFLAQPRFDWMNSYPMSQARILRAQGRVSEVPWSDSRLKTDIKQVGTSPSGISVYQFRYKENDLLYQGVLAQELLDTHPDAVVTMPNGYYGVRYDLIDVDFVKVSGKELVSSA